MPPRKNTNDPATNSVKKPVGRPPKKKEETPIPKEEHKRTFVMKPVRGRRKIPTSLVVFELNEKCLSYFLQDDALLVVSILGELVNQRKQLLFVSSSKDDRDKLLTKVAFLRETETAILEEQSSLAAKKEATMKAINENMNPKISPQSSVYIGTLFEKKDMPSQSFRFGKIYTPTEFFEDPDPFAKIMSLEAEEKEDDEEKEKGKDKEKEIEIQEVKEFKEDEEDKEDNEDNEDREDKIEKDENKNRKVSSVMSTPIKKPGIEIEKQQFEEFLGLEPEFDTQHPYRLDDVYSMNESSIRGFTVPRQRSTYAYYSQIMDLTSKISNRLSSALNKIKIKKRDFSDEDSGIADNMLSEGTDNSILGKRRINFEDELFDGCVAKQMTEISLHHEILNPKTDIKELQNMSLRIKSINLESFGGLDSQPIIKKVKGSTLKIS